MYLPLQFWWEFLADTDATAGPYGLLARCPRDSLCWCTIAETQIHCSPAKTDTHIYTATHRTHIYTPHKTQAQVVVVVVEIVKKVKKHQYQIIRRPYKASNIPTNLIYYILKSTRHQGRGAFYWYTVTFLFFRETVSNNVSQAYGFAFLYLRGKSIAFTT